MISILSFIRELEPNQFLNKSITNNVFDNVSTSELIYESTKPIHKLISNRDIIYFDPIINLLDNKTEKSKINSILTLIEPYYFAKNKLDLINKFSYNKYNLLLNIYYDNDKIIVENINNNKYIDQQTLYIYHDTMVDIYYPILKNANKVYIKFKKQQ